MSDFQPGPVRDSKGNPVEKEVLALAYEKVRIEVECDGFIYEIGAQRNRVLFHQTEGLKTVEYWQQRQNLLRAGFTEADYLPGGVLFSDDNESRSESAARTAKLNADPRWSIYLKLLVADPELRRARAEVAAAAMIWCNEPSLEGKSEVSGNDLLGLGRVGDALIQATINFMKSSPGASRAVRTS